MLSFEIHRWSDLDLGLRAAWAQLVERLGANPTQHPDWIDTVLASRHAVDGARVMVGRKGAEIVGVLPFQRGWRRSLGLPVRTIEPLSNLVSYHPMLVCDGCASVFLDELLRRNAAGSWHVFSMLSVVVGSPTHQVLTEFAHRSGAILVEKPTEQSPFLAVTQDWPSFYRTKNTKFRNNLQRSARLVNSAGAVEVRWYTGANESETLLEAILAVEAESWKSNAEVAIGKRRHETDYYRALLPMLAERGCLLANVLFLGGKPIAYCLVCIWQGWAGFLKNTYVERFKALGAGAHLIHLLLERAFGAGVREIDFLGDALSYKLAWTQTVRPHVDITMYSRAPIARLIGRVQERRATVAHGSPKP